MNVNRLRVFRCVYERSSISDAARALNLTQPPVTRMLRSFEGETGLKLFRREQGRLLPTPEADRLYRDVISLFDDFESLERMIENLRAGRSERLVIAASLSLSYAVLAPVLGRFRTRYPEIPIDVSTGTLRHQLDALERGDADLALTFDAPPAPNIISLPLGESTFVVILPIDHPLADQSTIELSDLSKYPILHGMSGSPLSSSDEKEPDGLQPDAPAGITVRSSILAVALTSARLGVVLIDRLSAAVFPRRDIVVRPLVQPIPHRIQALMRSQHRLSSAQEYFLEEIKVEIERANDKQALSEVTD